MNCMIAASTLKMHVAYTAVSIIPRPFSSECTRSPYIDSASLFIILRRRGVPALSKIGCSFMIGFEHWMRRRHELDSNNCHVERSETSLFASDTRFDQMIRDSSLRSE